jgi:hypothetical protein
MYIILGSNQDFLIKLPMLYQSIKAIFFWTINEPALNSTM